MKTKNCKLELGMNISSDFHTPNSKFELDIPLRISVNYKLQLRLCSMSSENTKL